ncbi:MAG: thioesterase family protein [Gammaproteobacteria bacterium]|nr:thioesterase family protein [Gammaproteobacteria bacterium]
MNLYIRLLLILLKSRLRPAMQPLDISVITLRVLLTDLDLNRHMNNGRFLTIMDLGRMDLLKRTGTLKLAIKNKWMPIVGTATIDFQRPLKLWQKYELHSRIYSWDDKWIYLEQTFISNDKLIAKARIKGLLRGKNGNIAPQSLMEAIQPGISRPLTENDGLF